jgi:hypothetical protein
MIVHLAPEAVARITRDMDLAAQPPESAALLVQSEGTRVLLGEHAPRLGGQGAEQREVLVRSSAYARERDRPRGV